MNLILTYPEAWQSGKLVIEISRKLRAYEHVTSLRAYQLKKFALLEIFLLTFSRW